MTAALPLQKRPIHQAIWEKTVAAIKSVAEQSNPRYSRNNDTSALEQPTLKDVVFTNRALMRNAEAAYVVKIYNEFFNVGRDESTGCYPCVRRALEFMRMLVVKDAPVVFDTEDTLKIYTLYDHPADFPNAYVVRCWLTVKGNPVPMAMAGPFMVTADLNKIATKMQEMGLTPIARNAEDDPKIMRTYL